ncbi:hypothetical protein HNY73_005441 [Argiope bruennichi]|uniref:Uncharacterized protein n=1 Tax=Argiope bruennichi TaxID=94029 RepID=A0A8T0FJL8_ARGBR|nr:hypothetical protein HNY73_005441 [Argiope bruennichi]
MMNWKLCKNLGAPALADPSKYHREKVEIMPMASKQKNPHHEVFTKRTTYTINTSQCFALINRRAEVFPLTLLRIMRHSTRHFVVYSFDRCVSKESQAIHRNSRPSTLSV